MIRVITCILFLCSAGVAPAATLYQWVEKDGSITFSPTPPAQGINYKTLNSDGVATIDDTDLTKTVINSATSPAPANTTKETLNNASNRTISNGRSPVAPLPAAIAPLNKIAYAPNTPQRKATRPVVSTKHEQDLETAASTQPQSSHIVSSKKRQQCVDLQKRIVSLEQRLLRTMPADAVDNTVVHIARYQQSHDSHCNY